MTKNSRQDFYAFVIFVLLCTLFSFSISAELLSCTIVRISDAQVILISVIAAVAVYAVSLNKRALLVFVALITIAAVFLIANHLYITLMLTPTPEEPVELSYIQRFTAYFSERFLFIRGYQPYRPEYARPVAVAIVSAFTCVFLFFYRMRFNFLVLLLTGITIFTVNVMIRYHNQDKYIFYFLMFAAIAFIQYLNLRNRMEKKLQYNANAYFTFTIVPVCLLAMLAASWIPSFKFPFDRYTLEQAFHSQIRATEDFFYELFNQKYFTFQSTGFGGGDSRLGGNVRLDGTVVMVVETDKNVYLTGEIKSEYDGAYWLSEKTPQEDYYENAFSTPFAPDVEPERLASLFEAFGLTAAGQQSFNIDAFEYAVNLGRTDIAMYMEVPINPETGQVGEERGASEVYSQTVVLDKPLVKLDDGSYNYSLIQKFNKLKVAVDGRLSASLFFPSGYAELDVKDEGITSNGLTLRSNSPLRIGKEYEYSYFGVDPSSKALEKAFLMHSVPGYYSSVMDVLNRLDEPELLVSKTEMLINGTYPITMTPEEIYGMLAAAADYYREHYTVLPDSLPQRVIDLAYEITAGEDTQYAKVKAVEEYLWNYSYTLSPGETPRGEDFADYFLFEQKRGYCTHFATAFTMLCRAVGIPVRYCEGYILPAYSPDKTVYYVTNAQAHAWPEVYFEGVGWVRFEPTATYYSRAYPTLSESLGLMPLEEDELWDDGTAGRNRRNAEGIDTGEAGQYAVLDDGQPGVSWFTLLWVALAVMLLFAGLFFGKYFWLRLWTKAILKRDNKTAATRYFKLIMYIAGLLCREKRLDETLNAYAVDYRIVDNSVMGVTEFRDAAEILSRSLYSPHIPTDNELARIKESYEMMKDKLMFVSGRTKYYYLLYIKLNVLKL